MSSCAKRCFSFWVRVLTQIYPNFSISCPCSIIFLAAHRCHLKRLPRLRRRSSLSTRFTRTPKLFDVFEVLSVMNDVHWPVLVLLIAFSELDVDEDEDMWEEGSRGWMGQGWGREPIVKTAAWAEGGAVEGGGGRGDCAALSFCVLRLALKYVQ